MEEKNKQFKTLLFYKYEDLSLRINVVMDKLLNKCEELHILGRVLVSVEGINGTVAGTSHVIHDFIDFMENILSFRNVDWKSNVGHGELPFMTLSIRQVDEIISCGSAKSLIQNQIKFVSDSFGGLIGTGKHLNALEFHEKILSTTNPVILDVRNDFEHNIGHFDGAIGLETITYSQSWSALDKIVESRLRSDMNQPVFMYCTGGIRCEKASAYMKIKGCDNVYQLQGGIHRYLEAFPNGDGMFKGKNFVFDSRVSVPASGDLQGEGDEDAKCKLGQCIDCSRAHDSYSGAVVCTVCRAPVLVCAACVQSSAHQEYWCSRHRALQGLYFTSLASFSLCELEMQRQRLRELLATLLGRREKHRRDTIRKQLTKITTAIDQLIAHDRDSNETAAHEVPDCRQTRTGQGFWKS